MFPPTQRNLTLMRSKEGNLAKLVQLVAVLEGGLLVRTTCKEALYIPAGCIHATFTIVGGFLISKDFTTQSSCQPFARYLAFNMDNLSDGTSKKAIARAYLDSLNVALANGNATEAIEAWTHTRARVEEWVKNDQQWAKRAAKIWKEFLLNPDSRRMTCSCDWSGPDHEFRAHLYSSHLLPLQAFLPKQSY